MECSSEFTYILSSWKRKKKSSRVMRKGKGKLKCDDHEYKLQDGDVRQEATSCGNTLLFYFICCYAFVLSSKSWNYLDEHIDFSTLVFFFNFNTSHFPSKFLASPVEILGLVAYLDTSIIFKFTDFGNYLQLHWLLKEISMINFNITFLHKSLYQPLGQVTKCSVKCSELI